MSDWRETRPPPDYYPYSLSLTPYAFMGLPKFLAGRIHQMRSGKGYLASHRPPGQGEPVAPTCPRCSSHEEDFHHAVFSCPPRAWAKARFLPGVASLGQESPIWSSPELVVALAKFIKATATGFPDNMPPIGVGSPTLEVTLPVPPPPPHGGPRYVLPPADQSATIRAFAAVWGASV